MDSYNVIAIIILNTSFKKQIYSYGSNYMTMFSNQIIVYNIRYINQVINNLLNKSTTHLYSSPIFFSALDIVLDGKLIQIV